MAALTTRPGQEDRCPYSRSFSAEFADHPQCPAYQSTTFVVTDMAHHDLGAALTCRHLTTGRDGDSQGRFYPRCGLGATDERLRWVAAATPARLQVMRSLDEEFDALLRQDRAALLEAKERALGSPDDPHPLEELEQLLAGFLDRADAFITERAGRLEDVGVTGEALGQLLHDWSLAWLRSGSLATPRMADTPIADLPAGTAALLGVETPATQRPAAELVFTAGPLTVKRADGVVRLCGEIDISNSDALVTGVMAAAPPAGDIVVDFADVVFCDLSGLRALVAAAQDLDGDRRIVVEHLPALLRRAVRIVGWADLPRLVVRGLAETSR